MITIYLVAKPIDTDPKPEEVVYSDGYLNYIETAFVDTPDNRATVRRIYLQRLERLLGCLEAKGATGDYFASRMSDHIARYLSIAKLLTFDKLLTTLPPEALLGSVFYEPIRIIEAQP